MSQRRTAQKSKQVVKSKPQLKNQVRAKPAPKRPIRQVRTQPAPRSISNPSHAPIVHTKVEKPHKKKKEKAWWETAIDAAVPLLTKYGPEIIAGLGDYEVESQTSNSVLAATTNGSYGAVPMIENSKTTNNVQHREYIGDVFGSTSAFSTRTYAINPGLDDSFPWLSPQAACYTGYRMKGLMYEFISDASEYSSTPYLGYVAMGTQYDSIDAPYPSKREMLNAEFSNSGKPAENLLHPVECSKAENVLSQLYIRTSNSGSDTSDKRFFDLGKFTIATGGQASEGRIGELWATYDIEFFKPKLSHSSGATVNSDAFDLDGVTNLLPLGDNNDVIYPNNTLGGTLSSGTTYNFPPGLTSGVYQVLLSWYGGGVAIAYPSITSANCGFKTAPWLLPSSTWNVPNAGTLTPSAVMLFYVEVTTENATFTFSTTGTLPTSPTTAFLTVTHAPTIMFGKPEEPKADPIPEMLKSMTESELIDYFNAVFEQNRMAPERRGGNLTPLNPFSKKHLQTH